MKRYLLFAGNDYYPNGGAKDFFGSFDLPEEAILYLNKMQSEGLGPFCYGARLGRDHCTWAHIWDSQTLEIQEVQDE